MKQQKNETDKMKLSGSSAAHGDDRVIPQFVKYRLSDDEMEQAKGAAETFSDMGEIVDQFISEGYKFSASHDSYGGGVQVFITPSVKTLSNAGFTLSARAPTLIAAVAVLCWKHYTLFSQEWPKETEERKGSNWG